MIVVLILILTIGLGYVVYTKCPIETEATIEPPPTEAELVQARLDLLRVERGVDVMLAREEAHREGQRTKAAIAEALDDGQ